MALPTSAKVQADSGRVAVSFIEAEKATTVRRRTLCHCSSLCVVTVACVIVTSLELALICVLGVSSIQRDIAIDKLQQQVADLQQTVATFHQQQQQQHIARLDIVNHKDELQTTHYTEVSDRRLFLG